MHSLKGSSLSHSARTPPAVHPEIIWGCEGGVPPHFLGAKSQFFCYLERHAKIQKCCSPLKKNHPSRETRKKLTSPSNHHFWVDSRRSACAIGKQGPPSVHVYISIIVEQDMMYVFDINVIEKYSLTHHCDFWTIV